MNVSQLTIALSFALLIIVGYWAFTYERPTYDIVDPAMREKYSPHESRFSFEDSDAYFINLDRSSDRHKSVFEQCEKQGLNIKRFPAINGKEIDLSDKTYEKYLKHMGDWYREDPKRVGFLGALLSHLKIYELFMQSPKNYCLIFEDDVEFLGDSFKSDVIKHMQHVPEDWDVILFGYHIDTKDKRMKRGNKPVRLVNNILNITYFTGLHGYMINKRSAKTLHTLLQEQEWIIDWQMGMLAERGLIKIYGIYPPIICQPAVYDVDVNGLKYTQTCKRSLGGIGDH